MVSKINEGINSGEIYLPNAGAKINSFSVVVESGVNTNEPYDGTNGVISGSSPSKSNNVGLIVGLVILVVVLAGSSVAYLCYRKK